MNNLWIPSRFHQRGLSLIELMISMVMGLFLLAGVIQIFVASKQSYQLTSSLGLVQENMRFSHYFISQDAERAGHLGCINESAQITNSINSNTTYDYNFQLGIRGYDATGTDWQPTGLPAVITAAALPASDVVVMRGISGTGVGVRAPFMGTTAASIQVDGNNVFNAGDIAIISDCITADIFQITNKTAGTGSNHALVHNTGAGSPGNAFANLFKRYGAGSEVSRLSSVSYYVANNTDGIPTLYRRIDTNPAEIMIEGVENMQILYGEDTSPADDRDYSVNRYVTANSVGNWSQVVSLRIGLLLRAEANVLAGPDTKTYDVLGTAVGPANDRRLRRTFTSTISLRNRLM